MGRREHSAGGIPMPHPYLVQNLYWYAKLDRPPTTQTLPEMGNHSEENSCQLTIIITLQSSSDLGLWIKGMPKHQIFRGSLCPPIVQEKEQVKETRGKEAGTWKGHLGNPRLAHGVSNIFDRQSPFYVCKYVLCQHRRDALTESAQGALRWSCA